MVPHDHRHHGHGHSHAHAHRHGVTSPHPAQAATRSILRMPVMARLGAALAASAVLWATVLLAMR